MMTDPGNVRLWGSGNLKPLLFAEGGEKEEKSRGKK
jgi:hypothetical protein